MPVSPLPSRTTVVSSRPSCPATSPLLRLLRPRLPRRSHGLPGIGAPVTEGELELAGDVRAPRRRQCSRGRFPCPTGCRGLTIGNPLRLISDPLDTPFQPLDDLAPVRHELARFQVLEPGKAALQLPHQFRIESVHVDEVVVLVEPTGLAKESQNLFDRAALHIGETIQHL